MHSVEVQDVIAELGIDFSQGYLYSEPYILPKETKNIKKEDRKQL